MAPPAPREPGGQSCSPSPTPNPLSLVWGLPRPAQRPLVQSLPGTSPAGASPHPGSTSVSGKKVRDTASRNPAGGSAHVAQCHLPCAGITLCWAEGQASGEKGEGTSESPVSRPRTLRGEFQCLHQFPVISISAEAGQPGGHTRQCPHKTRDTGWSPADWLALPLSSPTLHWAPCPGRARVTPDRSPKGHAFRVLLEHLLYARHCRGSPGLSSKQETYQLLY